MRKPDNTVKIAVIGLIGTVLAALLASPVLLELLRESDDAEQGPASGLSDLPPNFVTTMVYPADAIQRVEYEIERGSFSEQQASDLFDVKRVAFASEGALFQVDASVANTGDGPIMVDLQPRYFSLEDNLGRKAELVYFCCAAQDQLRAGASRDVQLFFRSEGWHGKGIAAQVIFFRVNGFLPVVRASWEIPTLATAN